MLALSATIALASGHAFATTTADSGDSGFGETGGDFSSAWFVSPLPNEQFEGAPVTIDVEIGVYQGFDDQITDIQLYLDGSSLGSQVCPEGCIFTDVVLEQGVHQFELVAAPNGYATSVTVYVDEELPSDTSGESGSGGESESGSGSEGIADEAEDGDSFGDLGGRGGCNAQAGPISPWALLAVPMLLLVPGVRRRR